MNQRHQPEVNVRPSDAVLADVNRVVEVTDRKGRVIKLKKPAVLVQYRIVEAVGPETAKNSVYMAMALPLLYVVAIDDKQIIMPRTKLELESLIQSLDEEGIDAVMTGVTENFAPRDPGADKAAIKN
jgi:hypothetical protein